MSNEQDKMQDFAKTLFDFLGTIREESNNLLKSWDLSIEQLRILQALNKCPHSDRSLSVEELKTHMLQKYSNVSRLIDKLVKKELVEKVPSEKDRRSVLIRLTEKGGEVLKDIDENGFKPTGAFVHRYGEKMESVKTDVQEMTDYLRHIYKEFSST